ncbi:MAG: cyanophycin synthetase, partial [Deinococcota bacterium]
LAKTLVDNLLRGDGDKPLVLELGIDHLGEMDGLVALAKPDIGILTLIAESHLKGLGTLENVATEKKKLINASPRKLVSAEAWHFLTPAEQAGAWCYGLEAQDADKPLPETTVLASVSVSQKDASQVLTVLGENLSLSTLGTAAARSATAAMALAKMLDDDLSQAAANISTAKFEGRRLEVHQLAGLTFIDDAYNSNPASMKQALEVLAHYPKPHTLVVGDMLELADRSETLHRELGKATKHLDRVIAVGPEASYIAA